VCGLTHIFEDCLGSLQPKHSKAGAGNALFPWKTYRDGLDLEKKTFSEWGKNPYFISFFLRASKCQITLKLKDSVNLILGDGP
jgi:hypothetical protein